MNVEGIGVEGGREYSGICKQFQFGKELKGAYE